MAAKKKKVTNKEVLPSWLKGLTEEDLNEVKKLASTLVDNKKKYLVTVTNSYSVSGESLAELCSYVGHSYKSLDDFLGNYKAYIEQFDVAEVEYFLSEYNDGTESSASIKVV